MSAAAATLVVVLVLVAGAQAGSTPQLSVPQAPQVAAVTGTVTAQVATVTDLITHVVGSIVPTQAVAPTGLAQYIVQLSDPPLASYRGGIAGLAPTNPEALGQTRLDAKSDASKAYLAYLAQQHTAFQVSLTKALGRAVSMPITFSYAFNGVVAVINADEAATVAGLTGVKNLERERLLELQTDAGPAWIGAPSIWDGTATGGPRGTLGEGVVVGDIDTGINHDHPSFAAKGDDGYTIKNPRGTYYGLCAPVTGAPFCNSKLIGVYDFTGTTPEDDNEHGSHTASTAVGNVINAAVLHAPTIDITRKISGVAPHANLITYKACTAAGCLNVSTTQAIDQATADGVDVINFSIGGGSRDAWSDSNAQAFLGARDAGIFASVAAGNSGPAPSTMGSPANAPWVTAVAASTHNRKFVNKLTGMSGGPADMTGAGVTAGYGPAKVVYAGDYGAPLCGAGPALPTGDSAINPFPPGTFHGEIVVCDRGTYGRLAKSKNVKDGGAGGYVLANDQANGDSLIGDAFVLPGVAVSYANGVAVKAWLAKAGTHTATIAGASIDLTPANGDQMASFSSRGPDKTHPNVLKPDIAAPGVDVLAAINGPATVGDPEYGILSGTSMATPHMTGAAALIAGLHNTWTPAEIQSALMTTAKTAVTENGKAAGPFARGAGRVDLTKAGLAGIVMNETAPNYLAANPATGGDPTTLNIPSLTSPGCEATCTWTRTVTSSIASAATWSVSTVKPRLLGLTVSPSRFTLAPGASQKLTITADVSKAGVGQWLEAEIRLAAGSAAPAAHLPVEILVGHAGSVSIVTNGTNGSQTVQVTSGVAIKSFQSRVYGLTKGIVKRLTMTQDPTPLLPYDSPTASVTIVDVPSGSKVLAAAITAATSSDVDLYVGRDANNDGKPSADEEVCKSATGAVLESCSVPNPGGGKYWILVQNWLTGQAVDTVDLAVATVPGTDNGNFKVTGPSGSVPAGTPFDLTLAWNEPKLGVGESWFALAEYGSDSAHPTNAGSVLVKLTRVSG
jgi:subtilisin family serine protease